MSYHSRMVLVRSNGSGGSNGNANANASRDRISGNAFANPNQAILRPIHNVPAQNNQQVRPHHHYQVNPYLPQGYQEHRMRQQQRQNQQDDHNNWFDGEDDDEMEADMIQIATQYLQQRATAATTQRAAQVATSGQQQQTANSYGTRSQGGASNTTSSVGSNSNINGSFQPRSSHPIPQALQTLQVPPAAPAQVPVSQYNVTSGQQALDQLKAMTVELCDKLQAMLGRWPRCVVCLSPFVDQAGTGTASSSSGDLAANNQSGQQPSQSHVWIGWCGHLYCEPCLRGLMRARHDCAVCRQPLLPQQHHSDHSGSGGQFGNSGGGGGYHRVYFS